MHGAEKKGVVLRAARKKTRQNSSSPILFYKFWAPATNTMGLYESLGADQQAEDLLELILESIEGDVLRLWCGSYAAEKRMHRLARAVFDVRLASAASVASGWDSSSVNACGKY